MKLNRLQVQKLKISPKQRVIIFSSATFVAAAVALIIYANFGISERVEAGTGMHGAKTVTAPETILNEFTTLSSNAGAGTTQISVASNTINSNGRFSGNLEAGSLIMIIQMQGATMNTASSTSINWGAVTALNNAGKYEFAVVASVEAGPKINLSTALRNSYTSAGKTQIVRVPRYSNLTVNTGASITTNKWNGSTGGIVAIEVNGTTTINGSINVAGKGFRGGAIEQSSTCCPGNRTKYASTSASDGGEKGESIAGTQTTYNGLGGKYGRGAPANGGGGGSSHNSSGGGGSNGGVSASWSGKGNPDNSIANWVTAWNLESAGFSSHNSSGGGRGGYSYSSSSQNPLTRAPGLSNWGGDHRFNTGGLGGRAIDTTGNRIYFGGGGGAGDSNDGTGSRGGDGGGIVYILTGSTLSGSGNINANGETAPNSNSTTDGDGSGGGGGGGTVYIFSYSAPISNITITANGGNGGSQVYSTSSMAEGEGGGGGGAGGVIRTSTASSLTRTVNGGMHGTSNALPMVNFLPNGATRGSAGFISTGTFSPYSGGVALPVKLKFFAATADEQVVKISWVTSSELNNDYFSIERSANGEQYTSIAKVNGNGNSTSDIQYDYIDDAPLQGTSFYRLIQTDYDGHPEIFPAVVIKLNNQESSNRIISVQPNPFSDRFTINCSTVKPGLLDFSIMDISGKVVRKVTSVSGAGINNIPFENLSDLKQGIYFIRMSSGNENPSTMKILKKD